MPRKAKPKHSVRLWFRLRLSEKSCSATEVMMPAARVSQESNVFDQRENTSHGKHAAVNVLAVSDFSLVRGAQPDGRDRTAEWLTDAAQQAAPKHGVESAAQGQVERQSHGKALDDVVHRQRHEHGEAELRVRMVGRKGDEALGKLVDGDGNGRLEANGQESILRYVVVV